MPDSDRAQSWFQRRAQRGRIDFALLGKEWHEQRWRFLLGAVVLSGLLAGLLRAQVIPRNEAVLFIYWPVGLIMVIFLAMGSVASERSNRTWEFLLAQPVSRAQVLMAKWKMGLYQLVGMMAIATVAGALALWSRGFNSLTSAALVVDVDPVLHKGITNLMVSWCLEHPILWLCLISILATGALACWYTPLFLVLTRARNEFSAALGGILLTMVMLFWLLNIYNWFFQIVDEEDLIFQIHISVIQMLCLNPITPLAMAFTPHSVPLSIVVLPFNIVIWILFPIWLVKRFAGRAAKI
ncbi:MAG: ABC transporter permease subunit [Planctomycetota bacterium]|jgi:ABC-type Na+ efflux pump permease subunit